MRYCEMCGCDISDRHSSARYCYKCLMVRKRLREANKKSYCGICGVEIPTNRHGVRYCPSCSCRVREFKKNISIRYKTIDICPEDCYVTENDAYINLAGAIVRLTLEDYEYALAMKIKYPQDMFYVRQLDLLTKQIHTEYFDLLCLGLNPESLIRGVNNLYNGPKGY